MPDVVLEDSSRDCDSGEATDRGGDDRFTTQVAHQIFPVNCDLNKDTAQGEGGVGCKVEGGDMEETRKGENEGWGSKRGRETV